MLRCFLPGFATPRVPVGGWILLSGILASVSVPMAGRTQEPAHAIAEIRASVVAARATALQLGGALSFGSSGYVRLSVGGGVGAAWKGSERAGAAHVDAVGRFHLDPYRASRLGLYGAAGLGGLYDGFDRWRAVLITAAGLELPARGGAAWALEVGLGGGVRVVAVLRRATPGRR